MGRVKTGSTVKGTQQSPKRLTKQTKTKSPSPPKVNKLSLEKPSVTIKTPTMPPASERSTTVTANAKSKSLMKKSTLPVARKAKPQATDNKTRTPQGTLPVPGIAKSKAELAKYKLNLDRVRNNMIKYRARKDLKDHKHFVVNHLCGDSFGQMKKEHLRGFLLIESTKMLAYLANSSFRLPEVKHNLRDIISAKILAGAPTSRGYVGVVSMELMLSLVGDLRARHEQLASLKWESIQRYLKTEGHAGKAMYYMFHWDQKGNEQGSMKNGYVTDWKVGVKSLRTTTEAMIDAMARNIVRGAGGSPLNATDQEVDQVWAYFPGLVRTVIPYNQQAHLDMGDKTGYIVHMPLTYEGMVLTVIPRYEVGLTSAKNPTTPRKTRESSMQAVYLFVPFGSYLVLPSKVNHSGVYGSPGNLRFHMAIRRRDDGDWGKDKFKFDATAKKHNSDTTNFQNTNWQTTMTVGRASYSDFTTVYTKSLVQRFGGLVDTDWMNLTVA